MPYIVSKLTAAEFSRLEDAGFTIEEHSPTEFKIWLTRPVMQILDAEIKHAEQYFSEPIADL